MLALLQGRHAAHRRRLTAIRLAAALALGLPTVAGCGAASSSSSSIGGPAATVASESGDYRGDVLPKPEVLTAPVGDATLRSPAGVTTLAQLQAAHPILLVYFGYTHCPDVCPTTVADIGVALRQLPAAQQARIQVAFITTDPARDTPPVLKRWLDNFDAGLPVRFLGLSGSVAQVDSIGNSLGVPLTPPTVATDGSIEVDHGTQVLAFVGGRAGLAWLAGTTAQSYAHDLRLLDEHHG